VSGLTAVRSRREERVMDKEARKANLHALRDCVVTVQIRLGGIQVRVNGTLCKVTDGKGWVVSGNPDVFFRAKHVTKINKAAHWIELAAVKGPGDA